MREGPEGDHVSARVPHLEGRDALGGPPEGRVRLDVDLPGAPEADEVVDVVAAEVDLERREDVTHRDAARLALGAVDVDEELGRVRAVEAEEPIESPLLRARLDEMIDLRLEPRRSEVAPVLDDDVEAGRVPEAVDRWRAEDSHLRFLDLVLAADAQLLGDRVGVEPGPAAVLELVEHDEERAEVGAVGSEEERLAHDPDRVGDAGGLLRDPLHPGDGLGASLGRRGVGELDVHEEVALVLLRDEARGEARHADVGEGEEAAIEHEDERAHAEDLADRPRVGPRRGGEDGVEPAEEPAEGEVEEAREPVLRRPVVL